MSVTSCETAGHGWIWIRNSSLVLFPTDLQELWHPSHLFPGIMQHQPCSLLTFPAALQTPGFRPVPAERG